LFELVDTVRAAAGGRAGTTFDQACTTSLVIPRVPPPAIVIPKRSEGSLGISRGIRMTPHSVCGIRIPSQ
jgi:hypothetical protein